MDRRKKSFEKQLKKSFIFIIMIPVLFLGGFIFYSSFQYVKRERLAEINNRIEQNEIDLHNRMEQSGKSLIYAVSNYTLQDFLQIDTQDYLELNNASKNVSPLLYNTILSNQYYKKMRIYTDKEYTIMNDLIHLSKEVQKEQWYIRTLESDDIGWWFQDEKLFLAKQIKTSYPVKKLGVMKVDIDIDIFRNSFRIFENVPIYIQILMGDETVYEYGKEEYASTLGFVRTDPLGNSGWDIRYIVDKSYFNQDISGVLLPMLIIVIVLCAVWFSIHMLSKILLRDIVVLVQEVNEIQTGNLDVDIQESEIEDVDILARSLKNMMNRIKQLIQQVYVKEIERQSIELDLLQAKINPHFLYNNLSAINWLALDCGQDRIYEITTEMATFYRTALNRGKNVDRLSVEIANIRSYVNLLQISHENSFDIEYDIEEGLLDDIIPIFILQPLVENAVEHGIDQLRAKRGILRISGYTEGGYLVLSVFDNGTALYDKSGKGAMQISEYGYGTSNVHRRIQILCGEDCGLTVSADEEGTTASIKLKEIRAIEILSKKES